MTCAGYRVGTTANGQFDIVVHCPGCAEAEKLRAELAEARGLLQRLIKWDQSSPLTQTIDETRDFLGRAGPQPCNICHGKHAQFCSACMGSGVSARKPTP